MSEYHKSEYQHDNLVAICEAVKTPFGWPLMTKRMFPNLADTITYGQAKWVNLTAVHCEDLRSLWRIVQHAMGSPHACLLRSVPIDANRTKNVRRLIRPDGNYLPTLVEHPQHWFPIDVDNFGVATGNVEEDARTVLLALPSVFHDIECITLASSSYLVNPDKPGINLRMFFWNDKQITAYDLKQYFSGYKHVVDTALFHPIQPIYIAPPIFVGRDNPVADRLVWIGGNQSLSVATNITHTDVGYIDGDETWFDKKQALAFLPGIFSRVANERTTERHKTLFKEATFCGTPIAQGHFPREELQDLLETACSCWDMRNPKKDSITIRDGIDRGIMAMGGLVATY
jgi:hypothetical protein